MNPEQEQFEHLRRLLVLKRYEQPPPGYFHRFPTTVIARIRVERARPSPSPVRDLLEHAGWLGRVWKSCQAQPVLAGALGVAVLGLLITGAAYSDHVEPRPLTLVPIPDPVQAPAQVADNRPLPITPVQAALGHSSLGGQAAPQAVPSLFQEFQGLQKAWVANPANFNAVGP